MNPTLDSPMDLLEVRSMVARYLDPTSSANCARVCRAWNPLFQPLAWKEVFYDQASRRRGLNPEVLERRKHFIHSLDVSGRSHSDIPSIWFTNLSSLKVAIQTQNIDVNVQRSLTALILGAPGVSDLYLECNSISWRTVSGLQNLRLLTVQNCNLAGVHINEFWSTVCPRLSTLRLRCVVISGLQQITDGLTFPNIQCLELKDVSGVLTQNELLVIAVRCTNLQDLAFSSAESLLAIRALVQHANGGTWPWPNTRSLRLGACKLTPVEMSSLLRSIGPCRAWQAPGARIREPAFIDLIGNFATLEELDLGVHKDLKSRMIQAILESCPRLLSFRGSRIFGIDDIFGQPWACTSLKLLDVHFVPLTPALTQSHGTVQPDRQEAILRRIATLTDLEVLAIGPSTNRVEDGIELTLRKWLGVLSPLTKLRTLRFRNTRQNMTRAEVIWMLDSWPKLSVVEGMITSTSIQGNQMATQVNVQKNKHVQFIV